MATTPAAPRWDRTLRTVMWLDAWLSVAMVAAGLVAAPVVAALGLPPAGRAVVGLVCAVSAVLLAAFGAVTGVLLMLRLRAGHYLLPPGMRPPLPPGMNPFADPALHPSPAR